jgi:hypothetical protein
MLPATVVDPDRSDTRRSVMWMPLICTAKDIEAAKVTRHRLLQAHSRRRHKLQRTNTAQRGWRSFSASSPTLL